MQTVLSSNALLLASLLLTAPLAAAEPDAHDDSLLATPPAPTDQERDALCTEILLRATTASTSVGAMLGLRARYRTQDRLVAGLSGYMSVAGPATPQQNYRNRRHFSFGYAGLELGYVYRHQDIDVVGRGLLAVGGVGHNGTRNDSYVGTDLFYVVEPSIHVALPLTPAFHLGVALGYRIGLDIQLQNVAPSDLNGLNLDVGVEYAFM